ncbi:MAG: 4Fe-4S cluster-binding domain-containing protein [Blautia sp.]|nr:4Fe-4S cluster-binding domain-containing protein [Blautia sp.]
MFKQIIQKLLTLIIGRKNFQNIYDKIVGAGGYLVLITGQACSLKCKECANFSPYALPETLKYNVDDIISDLFKVLCSVKKIHLLQIQGGEPFIYPELDKILDFCVNEKRINHIHIATNGTIIPGDKLIPLLQSKKITMRISNYEAAFQGNHVKELSLWCTANNISFDVYNFEKGNGTWDCLGKDVKREDRDLVVANRFKECAFKTCLTLENGWIGHCSRSIVAPGVQGFTPIKGDYIDVRNDPKLRRNLRNYVKKAKYMECCIYCYGTNTGIQVIAGEQLKLVQ